MERSYAGHLDEDSGEMVGPPCLETSLSRMRFWLTEDTFEPG